MMGHMGPTRNATLYASRCYLDDIATALRGDSRAARRPTCEQVVRGFPREARRMVPSSNENSFPGMMPNVIPARVANYFDLHGLNMTVDTGFTSALSAIETAGRYLRSVELEMAVVGGINGNSTLQMRDAVRSEAQGEPAEGAVLLALVREKTAVEAGLPVLGYVDDARAAVDAPAGALNCGAVPVAGSLNYLGAEGGVAILKALVNPTGQSTIACHAAKTGAVVALRLETPQTAAAAQPPATKPAIPAPFLSATEYAPGERAAVSRNVAVLKPFLLEAARAKTAFVPPGTLVLTNMPQLLAGIAPGGNEPAIVTAPPRPLNTQEMQRLIETAVAQSPEPIRHLRVLTNLGASAPPEESLYSTPQELVNLHDLMFLALKACFDNLNREGSSFVSLYLDAAPGGVLHPLAGLFNGTVKSSAIELRSSLVLSVLTDTSDVVEGVRQAELETTAKQFLPTVVYHKGVRQTFFLEPAPETLAEGSPARLGPDSVILATGGARGITAEILKTIARHFRPKMYLIGSNPLDQYPAKVFEGSDEEFAKGRPA